MDHATRTNAARAANVSQRFAALARVARPEWHPALLRRGGARGDSTGGVSAQRVTVSDWLDCSELSPVLLTVSLTTRALRRGGRPLFRTVSRFARGASRSASRSRAVSPSAIAAPWLILCAWAALGASVRGIVILFETMKLRPAARDSRRLDRGVTLGGSCLGPRCS